MMLIPHFHHTLSFLRKVAYNSFISTLSVTKDFSIKDGSASLMQPTVLKNMLSYLYIIVTWTDICLIFHLLNWIRVWSSCFLFWILSLSLTGKQQYISVTFMLLLIPALSLHKLTCSQFVFVSCLFDWPICFLNISHLTYLVCFVLLCWKWGGFHTVLNSNQ